MCKPWLPRPHEGGAAALHPANPLTVDYLAGVDGPDLMTVKAMPTTVPDLPHYLPQILYLTELRGALDEPIYCIRIGAVVKRRQRVTSAAEVRAGLGLDASQQLVLLAFDEDKLLERLWDECGFFVKAIAAAGYDLVVAPSYSTYSRRPRTEIMFNIKRSLVFFEGLQRCGACSIPRLAWDSVSDAVRCAEWARANPAVETVGLDLQTYNDQGLQRHLDHLATFDHLTRRRLRYLVNGLRKPERCAEVFARIPARRVSMTDATCVAPWEEKGACMLPGMSRGRLAASVRERCTAQRRNVADAEARGRARRAAGRRAHGSDKKAAEAE